MHLLRSCLPVALAATLWLGFPGAAAAAPATTKGTATYRWVDEHGEVHYGDQIPPQYAKQERTVLNAEGIPVQTMEAQKTPEQQANEAQERAQQMRQRQHDAFLVTTYTSVKDIESLRDARLEQMQGQRAAADQYVETLRSRLATLQTRAFNFRPYSANPAARRMPDDLAENLIRTVSEMQTQAAALTARTQEEAELRAQFQADIERYKELHTIHSQ
ncbi:MAG: DUF4124 domain-containing protein [Proteobacteria bacterium]|nr:DUF4124 domain-containing protein [Pseudomonadota bacterium]